MVRRRKTAWTAVVSERVLHDLFQQRGLTQITSASTFRKRSLAVLGGTVIAVLTLGGCSVGGSTSTAAASITVRKHYDNAEVDPLIGAEAVETDASKRTTDIETIQDKVAADLSTVPLLQGAQVAVSCKKVSGVTRDGSFEFCFGTLSEFCEEDYEPSP